MNKKQRLRKEADKLWFQKCIKDKCEICGESGYLQVHHFFPKGQFGHLRYNLDNGISLCRGCHFHLHHQDPRIQQKIIAKRGIKWYTDLLDISRENPASYQTIKYYQDIIKQLNVNNL